MAFETALAHRLQRVYLPLLVGLLLVWLVRLNGQDGSLVEAAAVSGTPGWLVLGGVAAVYVSLVVITMWPDMSAISERSEAGDRGDLDSNE